MMRVTGRAEPRIGWLHGLLGAVALGWATCIDTQATLLVQPDQPKASEIIELVALARAGAGLPPFTVDPRLVDAAEFHNQWMRDNGCYDDECPGEPDLGTRILRRGYDYGGAGESILKELASAEAVLSQWLIDPIDHGNIMLRGYVDIGCAYLDGPGGPWWTCVLARPL